MPSPAQSAPGLAAQLALFAIRAFFFFLLLGHVVPPPLMQASGLVISRHELNIECRTLNFELRSFVTLFVPFDIHHSLFDILRFKTRLIEGSTSSQSAKKLQAKFLSPPTSGGERLTPKESRPPLLLYSSTPPLQRFYAGNSLAIFLASSRQA
jgi:hypothetical protein